MVQMTTALLNPWLTYCLGRTDDYALQQADGRYLRAGAPVSYEAMMQHLQGMITIGTYVINEHGLCHFAVFDDDAADGLRTLHTLQTSLAGLGVVSYLELSRRGAHLWVFLAEPMEPLALRRWLLLYCPAGVEFYPKQDALTPARPYGSLVRLPLGVHQRSGQRYPFVEVVNGAVVPLAASVCDLLALFPAFERVPVPQLVPVAAGAPVSQSIPADIPFQPPSGVQAVAPQSIRDWCLTQDPLAVIGRYVALDSKGLGCCPFGWHHGDGVDTHPSLYVYRPTVPNLRCWYCHTWRQGGSLFDFLRYYYGLEARDLWSRLQAGAHL